MSGHFVIGSDSRVLHLPQGMLRSWGGGISIEKTNRSNMHCRRGPGDRKVRLR